MSHLLTTSELAKYLGVHVKTVYTFIRPDRKKRPYPALPCESVGGRLRFRLSDVDAWTSARREGR